MVDVVFISPNTNGSLAKEAFGILQLATILEKQGISCKLLPFYNIGDPNDLDVFVSNALSIVKELNPKIVSFYTRCDVYHIDLRLAEQIKKQHSNIYIIFGGPQSDIVSTETLKQIKYVDYICCGEGENTVFPFFSSVLSGNPDHSVAGLVYREAGEIRKNPRPQLIEDLDSIPLIDYSLFVSEFKNIVSNKDFFPIDVGRGCPFGCTYCSTKSFWGRHYRLKSPNRIYQEIKELHTGFGLTRFYFTHDMFTLNRKSVIETCRLLKTLDFDIEWRCSARLDCIDKELIDIMIDAGMKWLFIGIETGSPRMQKLINKNLKLDKVVELTSYLSENNVDTTASFIYGFPEETEEDLNQTFKLILQIISLKNITVQTHLCTFLAGTELADKYKDQLTRTDVYSNITGNMAIRECIDLITDYPELFPHMKEYKTELRTKLRYFTEFFYMFRFMFPVYSYLGKKYSDNRLLDMYYDFVEANADFLDELAFMSYSKKYATLINKDRFYERFSSDKNYDIISDIYRLKKTNISDEVKNGQEVTDIYCFSPEELAMNKSIDDFERCIAVVTSYNNENGVLSYKINKM